MALRPEEVTSVIKGELEKFKSKMKMESVGTILQVGDGIARVYGLDDAMMGELVELPGGIMGMVLNLEEESVGIAIFGSDENIKDGDTVKRIGKIAQVPTSALPAGTCGQGARRQGRRRARQPDRRQGPGGRGQVQAY